MEQNIPYNNPVNREVHNKARKLQRKLWVCAKQDKGRKFHALYDRICSWNIMLEAYCRVRARQGACGIDGQTIEEIEVEGVEKFLREIQGKLKEGKYRPLAVKRVTIPKREGGKRSLGIPAVRDRIVQMAANIVLMPIFEADFKGSSYGYRPKRNATQALERIRIAANKGYNFVVDGDIKDYFNTINHELLLKLCKRRISDRRVIKLIRKWLENGVMAEGKYQETTKGTPQGSVISPLLSNIYLDELDSQWEGNFGVLTRYCDDLVIQYRNKEQAKAGKENLEKVLGRLYLALNPEKTRIVNLGFGKEGFEFLGNYIKKTPSYRFAGKYFLNRWPTKRKEKEVREKIRNVLNRKRFGIKNIRELVPEINRILQGWGNYFKSGNANKVFNKIDQYVYYRTTLFENRRRNRPKPHWIREFTYEWYKTLGIHQLKGTVCYPKESHVLAKANT